MAERDTGPEFMLATDEQLTSDQFRELKDSIGVAAMSVIREQGDGAEFPVELCGERIVFTIRSVDRAS